MGTADIKDENALEVRHVEDFHSVGSGELAWTTGRLASGVGFHGVRAAVVGDSLCPGLIGSGGIGGTAATIP